MQITQLTNSDGKPAANQFLIKTKDKTIFQSYETIICEIKNGKITLDSKALNYSNTTSKHLYVFLGMKRKEIEKEIKSGKITLKDLN